MTPSDNNADNFDVHTVSTVDNVNKISKVKHIMNATSTTTSSSTTMKKHQKGVNTINIKKKIHNPSTSTNEKHLSIEMMLRMMITTTKINQRDRKLNVRTLNVMIKNQP
jgi:hypothetical protein